jgi:neurotransmitter:Na+ symporter, NSS family
VFPKALSMIPCAPLFAVLFFVMLVTLAIDSAFSLVEAVVTSVHDKYPHVRKEDVSLYVCVAGFVCGMIFTTSAGIYYLDITDHFITNYGLVIVGLLEALTVGWLYGADKLRKYINHVSEIEIGRWWDVMIKYVIPVGLIVLLAGNFIQDIRRPYGNYPQWALFTFGWLALVGVLVISYLVSHFSKEKP